MNGRNSQLHNNKLSARRSRKLLLAVPNDNEKSQVKGDVTQEDWGFFVN